MPKKNRGKKKDDDWYDDEAEKKLEEKMKNIELQADEGSASKDKKSKKVNDINILNPAIFFFVWVR